MLDPPKQEVQRKEDLWSAIDVLRCLNEFASFIKWPFARRSA